MIRLVRTSGSGFPHQRAIAITVCESTNRVTRSVTSAETGKGNRAAGLLVFCCDKKNDRTSRYLIMIVKQEEIDTDIFRSRR